MDQSILLSTKKILGVDEGYDAYDLDIMTHINTSLSVLHQIGIGPEDGVFIENQDTKWDALELSDHALSMVKTYVFLKTQLLFDPPTTSFAITAKERQIAELEGRLSIDREVELYG